ncbi:hypothetical protein BS17DRAFT_772830 [Gyrodon lividus]|nr:hypothetical protein BS17DRAFT_772830 [Gyrodon lividus]
MSLYTPVFPSSRRKPNNTQKVLSAITSTPAPKKQQNYAELLRDVHLFLSTQSDVLSPPSRPNSPNFDHRVKKLREAVRETFDAAGGESANGMWTHVSQMLKMGGLRGRYWSVYQDNQRPPEEDLQWILPDEEDEWIEWEKKREEIRRLKGKMKASQQVSNVTASIAPDSRKPNHANLMEPGRSQDPAPTRAVPAVSPATLLKAKEKVRKWQATMAPDISPDTTSSSPASMSVGATQSTAKGKALGQQGSRALGFPVIKRAVAPTIGKKSKGRVARPVIPCPSQDRNCPEGSPRSPNHPAAAKNSGEIGTASFKTSLKASLVTDEMSKVTDFPETSYLPPSFPSRLETSTPLPRVESAVPVRAKPPPILPFPPSSSSAPLPSTPSVESTGDRTHIQGEPHAANLSSLLPLQIDAPQPIKRSRLFSLSQDDIPNGSPVTPPAKKLRTISQSCSVPLTRPPVPNGSMSISPNGASQGVCKSSSPRDGTCEPNLGAAPSHRIDVDPLQAALDAPLPHDRSDEVDVVIPEAQDFPQKNNTPAKSTKSFFSAPDSDPSNSPISNNNLLLHSPISPMLSFAQNPNAFLPQYTSTQLGQNSFGRRNSGIFGMGYNSQFDVEKHVDRVSELLEKDVDFDGWLRDVPTAEGLEASQDQ